MSEEISFQITEIFCLYDAKSCQNGAPVESHNFFFSNKIHSPIRLIAKYTNDFEINYQQKPTSSNGGAWPTGKLMVFKLMMSYNEDIEV